MEAHLVPNDSDNIYTHFQTKIIKIRSVFQLDNEQSISDYCASVSKSSETDILPFHFGLSASNRDDLINNHTTEITKKLFDVSDNLFII